MEHITFRTENFKIDALPDDQESEVQLIVKPLGSPVEVGGGELSFPLITVNLSPAQARLLIEQIEQSLKQLQ